MGNKPQLLEQVRREIRIGQVSVLTAEAEVQRFTRLLGFQQEKGGRWIHSCELGNDGINEFHWSHAAETNLTTNTQGRALSERLYKIPGGSCALMAGLVSVVGYQAIRNLRP